MSVLVRCSGVRRVLRLFGGDARRRLSSETKQKKKKDVNVGTIGHVDHGKTTLSAALTRVASLQGLGDFTPYAKIDSAPEEKARGITINASHIQYSTQTRNYAHTDCPGHADYIKNMISGASQMEAAILVVAATDGQMPQTREHLLLARQVGVSHVVVYINKVDLVDDPQVLELVELEMREMLTDYGFDGANCPVILGSALKALEGSSSEEGEPSIRKLLDALDSYVPDPPRDFASPFVLPVDRSFTATGRGTVVVGTIKRGTMKKNAEAELLGFGHCLKCLVGDVEVFKKSVVEAKAGQNVGVLLRGSVRSQLVEKGMILAAAGSQRLTNRYTARVYFLPTNEGGRNRPIVGGGYIQQLFSQTWNLAVRLDLGEGGSGMVMPGEDAVMTLTLLKGMPMDRGQPFTVRENNATVATGIVLESLPPVQVVNNNLAKIKSPS